jgi:hypothetical protein
MTKSNIVTIEPASSPLALIQSAVASGASIETLGQLMTLQERWEANEGKKQFYKAMQEFARLRPSLPRASKVKFTTQKGTTEYNFCSLPDIEKALKEPLAKCGLFYRFENYTEGEYIGIRCIVSHVAGHSESTPMRAPLDTSGNKNNIQGIGSTSSYLMRYTLIAAFGLTTADEDDDGQSNSDMPYLKLLQQNKLLQDVNLLKVIVDIKESLAANDYETVIGYMAVMTDEVKSALWIAPTRGGVFTTKEVAAMKSNEYVAARTAYYAQEQAKGE